MFYEAVHDAATRERIYGEIKVQADMVDKARELAGRK